MSWKPLNYISTVDFSSCTAEGPCLIWPLGKYWDGYGRASFGGKYHRAHRIAFERVRGPIPPGKIMDHLCRVRACFNPWHVEPVTNRENLLRGETSLAANVAKTHCPQGHPLNYSWTSPSGVTHRHCRECSAARQRTPEAKAYAQRWREANREKCRQYTNNYLHRKRLRSP